MRGWLNAEPLGTPTQKEWAEKVNPFRNITQKQPEGGRKSEQMASQMQEEKVFQEDDLYCVCANIYKALQNYVGQHYMQYIMLAGVPNKNNRQGLQSKANLGIQRPARSLL